MALTISDQFNKFVEFAETQRNPRTHSRIGNILGYLKIQGAGLHCTTGFTLTLN